ncbi:MAG: hypothetical protein AAGB01_03565 [Cyanobacteria bacterium P01_F01_bin.42]
MPDTVSIIRAEGNPLSVDAERKHRSDWLKQEAQILMDELFYDLGESIDAELSDDAAVDVDWVDGIVATTSSDALTTTSWAILESSSSERPLRRADASGSEQWITQSEQAPFYRRFLLILGGLALVAPLSFWGVSALREASRSRSVIAAIPASASPDSARSNAEFSRYAEQALRQINLHSRRSESSESSRLSKSATSLASGSPLLTRLSIGAVSGASVLPPLTPIIDGEQATDTDESSDLSTVTGSVTDVSAPETAKALERLPLRVFKPTQPVQSQIPSLDSDEDGASVPSPETLPEASLPDLASPPSLPTSSITPAPTDLPTLAANVADSMTVAAATPMSSPANASKRVIGIIELGLQSTLMVTENGSHLNFKVGDTVNNDGWKLVQINQGKAILQNGAEYKTLSEGQFF